MTMLDMFVVHDNTALHIIHLCDMWLIAKELADVFKSSSFGLEHVSRFLDRNDVHLTSGHHFKIAKTMTVVTEINTV